MNQLVQALLLKAYNKTEITLLSLWKNKKMERNKIIFLIKKETKLSFDSNLNSLQSELTSGYHPQVVFVSLLS